MNSPAVLYVSVTPEFISSGVTDNLIVTIKKKLNMQIYPNIHKGKSPLWIYLTLLLFTSILPGLQQGNAQCNGTGSDLYFNTNTGPVGSVVNKLYKITVGPTGNVISGPTQVGSNIVMPAGVTAFGDIAFDNSGNLYAVEGNSTPRAHMYPLNKTTAVVGTQIPATGNAYPFDAATALTFDNKGYVYSGRTDRTPLASTPAGTSFIYRTTVASTTLSVWVDMSSIEECH